MLDPRACPTRENCQVRAPCLPAGENSRVSQSKMIAGLFREMHRPNVSFSE